MKYRLIYYTGFYRLINQLVTLSKEVDSYELHINDDHNKYTLQSLKNIVHLSFGLPPLSSFVQEALYRFLNELMKCLIGQTKRVYGVSTDDVFMQQYTYLNNKIHTLFKNRFL